MFETSASTALVIFIINIIFFAGVWYGKLRNMITKQEVKIMINKEIKEQLENQCIKEIKSLLVWKKEHSEWGSRENDKNHSRLSEIAFNLKNICNKLGITYIKKNGY